MLAADHNREWKQYQRKFRAVETWTADSRIDEQQTADYQAKRRQAEEGLGAGPRRIAR